MSAGDTISIDTGSSVATRRITGTGTAAGNHTTLWQPLPDGQVITIPAGSTNVPVTSVAGFVVGDRLTVGTPANRETVTITAVGTAGPTGSGVDFTPALAKAHLNREDVVAQGTGISFKPATAFAHSSNRSLVSRTSGNTKHWSFVICDWVFVIFLWIKWKGTRLESLRRILCLKLLPTRSNGGWFLLR